MKVHISPNDKANPPGKLADCELQLHGRPTRRPEADWLLSLGTSRRQRPATSPSCPPVFGHGESVHSPCSVPSSARMPRNGSRPDSGSLRRVRRTRGPGQLDAYLAFKFSPAVVSTATRTKAPPMVYT